MQVPDEQLEREAAERKAKAEAEAEAKAAAEAAATASAAAAEAAANAAAEAKQLEELSREIRISVSFVQLYEPAALEDEARRLKLEIDLLGLSGGGGPDYAGMSRSLTTRGASSNEGERRCDHTQSMYPVHEYTCASLMCMAHAHCMYSHRRAALRPHARRAAADGLGRARQPARRAALGDARGLGRVRGAARPLGRRLLPPSPALSPLLSPSAQLLYPSLSPSR